MRKYVICNIGDTVFGYLEVYQRVG